MDGFIQLLMPLAPQWVSFIQAAFNLSGVFESLSHFSSLSTRHTMDTTSDLLKVCKETREIVANILKGKKQLKRTVEETADSSLSSDAQLP